MPVSKSSQPAVPTAVPTTDALLAMRVSDVLKLHDGALDLLIAHGFTPLAQSHLRALLAPTVTLAQASRLKSLSPAAQERLLADLQRLLATEPGACEPAAAERAAAEQAAPEPRDSGAVCP